MAEPMLQVTSTDDVCRRCCLPGDLLPIQQAAVIRSFPPAYAKVVMGAGVDDPPRPPLPEASALEHATYVGAMFAAVYIRLLAIDEAAEHLRDADSVFLLDAAPLAVAGPGLFLKAGLYRGRTSDLVGCCSESGETPGSTERRVRERGW